MEEFSILSESQEVSLQVLLIGGEFEFSPFSASSKLLKFLLWPVKSGVREEKIRKFSPSSALLEFPSLSRNFSNPRESWALIWALKWLPSSKLFPFNGKQRGCVAPRGTGYWFASKAWTIRVETKRRKVSKEPPHFGPIGLEASCPSIWGIPLPKSRRGSFGLACHEYEVIIFQKEKMRRSQRADELLLSQEWESGLRTHTQMGLEREKDVFVGLWMWSGISTLYCTSSVRTLRSNGARRARERSNQITRPFSEDDTETLSKQLVSKDGLEEQRESYFSLHVCLSFQYWLSSLSGAWYILSKDLKL